MGSEKENNQLMMRRKTICKERMEVIIAAYSKDIFRPNTDIDFTSFFISRLYSN